LAGRKKALCLREIEVGHPVRFLSCRGAGAETLPLLKNAGGERRGAVLAQILDVLELLLIRQGRGETLLPEARRETS
jgi:hypothetical protein